MTETPWYIENVWIIVVALMGAAKVIINLVPTEKPKSVFGVLDKIVNALIPDNIKNEN
jgi:hypothetical protein|tara:strand:- start:306 stop:479 length:174 start_codon:yes stop_codon:yes gene_type:complete